MTIAQSLGIPQSTEDFLSDYWKTEYCDPDNWTYLASTYFTPGVRLIGSPHMRLWEDSPNSWKNPGRYKFSASRVLDLVREIETKGIDPKIGSFVYYDVDTGETVNGEHRRGASDPRYLAIPGWMMQGVQFENEAAKIKFATKSNNRLEVFHTNTSPDDVESAARQIVNLEKIYTFEGIKDLVKELGAHLTDYYHSKIAGKIYAEYTYKNGVTDGVRYRTYNQDTVNIYIKSVPEEETWFEQYYTNCDELCLYIQVQHFEARIGSVLSLAERAVEEDKPVHFLISLPIPQGKASLDSKRLAFFSTHLQNLETRLINISSLGSKHRAFFPWNHPEAQHRFLPQDTENEDINSLIYVPNRQFN
tara:strand:- start:29126 stop:30208 length:1083 start_codon:yes stop_codon:yes gene_type:complete